MTDLLDEVRLHARRLLSTGIGHHEGFVLLGQLIIGCLKTLGGTMAEEYKDQQRQHDEGANDEHQLQTGVFVFHLLTFLLSFQLVNLQAFVQQVELGSVLHEFHRVAELMETTEVFDGFLIAAHALEALGILQQGIQTHALLHSLRESQVLLGPFEGFGILTLF